MTASFIDFIKLIYSRELSFQFLTKNLLKICGITHPLSTLSAKIETLSSDVNTFIKPVINDVKKQYRQNCKTAKNINSLSSGSAQIKHD